MLVPQETPRVSVLPVYATAAEQKAPANLPFIEANT